MAHAHAVFLFDSSRQGLDAGQDGRKDHQSIGDEGEPVVPGAFDIGPAEDDGADTERLYRSEY